MENQDNESSIDAYQDRIVAYADILGWGSATQNGEFKSLLKTLKCVEDYASNFSSQVKDAIKKSPGIKDQFIQEHNCIKFSFFSDCFAVSAPMSNGKSVFKILAFASHKLLRNKFLLRGGVTVGKLYHSQRIIFGPALTEAVEIEEKDAISPRFLCSKKLIQFLDNTDYKNSVVLQDCCENWVVNIAVGSPIAQNEIMNIIAKWLSENESDVEERIAHKWRYMQKMIPIMYRVLISEDQHLT